MQATVYLKYVCNALSELSIAACRFLVRKRNKPIPSQKFY